MDVAFNTLPSVSKPHQRNEKESYQLVLPGLITVSDTPRETLPCSSGILQPGLRRNVWAYQDLHEPRGPCPLSRAATQRTRGKKASH